MTAYKNRGTGKICIVGILIICGLLLTSVDDCESMYLEETANSGQQQRIAQEQAARNARAERERAEQERRAAAQSNSRNRPASGAQSGSQGTGSQAAASQGAASQSTASQGAGSQAAAASGGTGQPTASSGASYLSSISGKDWKLLEVRRSDKTLTLDRNKLTADGMGDLFTLNVDTARLSGKAAPNRYISTYQAGENNALTIAPSISTLMASIYDPERLREQEYFQYLSKVKSWKLNQGKLELYTVDVNNKEAVLVYGN
ncbi:MAG: META domain-containing protein [Treponema sp.]|jgi:heat shock protein HslJ|nr:META domain-containing protein [Treponema sp.]